MNEPTSSRRGFIKNSAAGLGAVALATATRPPAVHAAGDDMLRIGLVGCGGRGTGAAAQALKADDGARLVAMADAFDDRLEKSLTTLTKKEDLVARIDVPAARQFVGFDAYRKLLDTGVDVVLLTTPPHFRPLHLKAAIEAGVHVFAEKPVAVDAPGVRSILETCRQAEEKKLSVVSGLCLRYCYGFREAIRRIHEGQLGTVTTVYANDYRGGIWRRAREPDWTDMHYQMRNWYYYTWLSGDFNVEQHVHYLDICAWAKGNRYPAKAIGMGGRQVRTGPEYGNIYDHHSVVYEYDDGARLVANTRQIPGCKGNSSAQVVGTKGRGSLDESSDGLWIESGGQKWTYDGERNQFYQTEHDELFASIRSGEPINNGEYMAHSTMLAILGRMATYTGQEIAWEQAINSQEDLSPERYEWGPAPDVKIAMPGVTKFR